MNETFCCSFLMYNDSQRQETMAKRAKLKEEEEVRKAEELKKKM